jgi:8-oxo-dGTP pyrophosphatase MutT (NUDIX family)
MTTTSTPSTAQSPAATVIFAAGGLLFRHTSHGPEIAIIHRARYGDWTLPKGKVQETDKSWQAAALREVKEETGCEARITGFIGPVTYSVKGTPKVVLFWNMALEGECAFQPSEEVRQVVWLSPHKALAKMDHAEEKRIVAQVYPETKPRRTFRFRLFGKSRPYHRLAGSLAAYREELEYRISQSQPHHEADQLWTRAAHRLLDSAQAELNNDNLDEGWKCLMAAQRLELFGLTDEVRLVRAKMLRAEADKVGGWRQKAIEAILDDECLKQRQVSAERLYEAQLLRDEKSHNQYYKMGLLQDQLQILLRVVGLTMLVVLGLAASGIAPLGDWRMLAAVALFGVMGASFSAFLSLARTSIQSRIPEQIVHSSITLMRPLLGAAAAVAVYVFLQSGLLNFVDLSPAMLLAFSFAAGFSERLLIQSVESLTGREQTERP